MNSTPDTSEEVETATNRGVPSQYVLYPIFESHDEQTFEIARDIAAGAEMTLLVLDLLDSGADVTDESRTVAGSLLSSKLDEERDVEIETRFVETTRPVQTVAKIAKNRDTRLIVFDEFTPEPLLRPITGDVPDRLSEDVPCNVVSIEQTGDRRLASILVPIADGPHSSLGVAVAGAIARSAGAVLELFHVTEPDEAVQTVQTRFEAATEQFPTDVEFETWHLQRESVTDAIVEQSRHYDMTIIGEPDRGRLRRFVFGSVTDDVRKQATNTVLSCRNSDSQQFEVLGESAK